MLKAKPEFISYKNKQILYLNFSNMDKDYIPVFMTETKELVSSMPHNSILFLANVFRMGFDHTTVKQFIEFSNVSRQFSRGTAVVGIDPVKKVLYEAAVSLSGRSSKNIKMYINSNDEIQAKDWLVNIPE
jgi:hypothetical protein